MHWLHTYIQAIDTIGQTGADTEGSYRTEIHNLLTAAAATTTETRTLQILHEPQRLQGNAPDFRITNAGGAIVGYVECKKPHTKLLALLDGDQLRRYTGLSPNIILTDGWQWILLRAGQTIAEVSLTTPDNRTAADFSRLLEVFFSAPAEHISDAKRLAEALAVRCQLLRGELNNHIGRDQGKLRGLFDAFRKLIYHQMQADQFADSFAQTTVYSLLMAKLRTAAGTKLDLFSVEKYIPQTFSLVRELSGFLSELEREEYRGLAWAVNDLLAIVNNLDVAAVVETMSYSHTIGTADSDDPFLYFYENFLATYDPALRKARGVYYTPLPVVRFIVRAIDDLLKAEFGIHDGLADQQVTALDFATGTGTFLLALMQRVLHGKSPIECRLLTNDHLLPNCYGFEFLIAPYTVAHLKLSQFLADKGAALDERHSKKQLNIFLTNTLEEISNQIAMPLLPALSEEARLAGEIKKNPILVIMGNPPYSGHSQNKGEFIKQLVRDYYQVDGVPLGDRNPKWLQDDYVKFMRFAQYKMQSSDRGIVAIITNHGFLDNPTFRGMRHSLMTTFDRLYFLDLHGNARKKETAPDGGKDENIFDIQQGVGISLLVKNPGLTKGVFRYDVFGRRDTKYDFCATHTMQSVTWKRLKPAAPFYLFTSSNKKKEKTYQTYPSIKDIFNMYSAGLVTARDLLTIGYSKDQIRDQIASFAYMPPEQARRVFNLGKDSRDWKIALAQQDLIDSGLSDDHLQPLMYRPFDVRHTYYTGHSRGFHCMPRQNIMQHMLAGDNLALITHKREELQVGWSHAMITKYITEHGCLSSKTTNYLFPLYIYDGNANGNTHKTENIKPAFRRWLDQYYGEKLSPESIIGYLYAVLHSPNYRRRYVDFLRIDFPRVPFTPDLNTFHALATIGSTLIHAHLLQDDRLPSSLSLYGHDRKIETIRYFDTDNKLFINKESYFAPLPPEVYHFLIGGYLAVDKYLKSRKHRNLTLLDVQTIKKITAAIAFTAEQMAAIDRYNLDQ